MKRMKLWQIKQPRLKKVASALVLGFAVLGAVNIGVWLAYKDRVLPNYYLAGQSVGGLSFSDIANLEQAALLPEKIILNTPSQSYSAEPGSMGISVDIEASIVNLRRDSQTLLPVAAFFQTTKLPLVLSIDDSVFDQKVLEIAKQLDKQPVPKRIIFNEARFELAPAEDGYKLNKRLLKTKLKQNLVSGQVNIKTPLIDVPPEENGLSLEPKLASLNQTLAAADINYHYNGKTIEPGPEDIGKWYKASGQTVRLSPDLIKNYINRTARQHFKTVPNNQTQAVEASLYALSKNRRLDFVIAADETPIEYTYCAKTLNVSKDELPEFSRTLAAVLGDVKGWQLEGKITFKKVNNGCDFTAWLSAASNVPDFNPQVCSSYYSCRVGRNVIINYDRWRFATTPWNQAGGGLEDYRAMVVNHEVGHWLDFRHLPCPSAGRMSPVMGQQSKNLAGCRFNPWPTETELATLKRRLNL